MRKNWNVFSAIVLALLLLFVGQSFAQERTGVIRGTVRDETGEPLPGVNVELRGEALMGARSDITGVEGEFRFPALPIGKDYELRFSLSGFQTLTRKNLRVIIGGTVILDIVLKPSALEEEVTVIAEAPLVDVEKSGFSSTYDAEILETLPTRRYTFFDMVQASPGITPPSRGSSRVSAFGGEVKSNAYYINGIDISAPSTGAAWPWPMPDVVDELEVTGVGAPAEYGNFQGAVINVVSKSGSNTFHGAVKYFLQHEDLTGNNTPEEKWPYHVDHWHDAIFQLSGPVVKDRLWFFASVQHQVDRSTGVGANPEYAPEYRMTPTAVVKIDFQLNKSNKISMFAHYESYQSPGLTTEYTPYETVSQEMSPAIAPTVEWLSFLSKDTYFELKYGGFYTNLKWDPVDGDMTTPGRYDWGTGYASVNATGFYHWPTNRTQFNAAVSHYASDFIKGNHEFKFGVQYSHGYSDFVWGYIGGVAYYDWMGEPYAAYVRNPAHYGGAIDQFGVFVDDTWEVSSRLTLNLGLRFDYNHGEIPDFEELDRFEEPTGNVIPGIPDVANWKNLSPRIGLNYQLTPDRKTVLRASYGRYYEAMIIGDFDDATPARTPLYAYGYNPDTEAYDILWWTWNPTTDLGLDSDLKAPYTDQFSMALERELITNLSFSATLVYKINRNRIDTLNTAAQYEEVPFYDADSGGTITVYNQLLPLDNLYMITNPGDKITYRGLMLVLNKRFANNFQVYSSFTWSRAWWEPKGYEDKNELINAEGPMRIGSARDRTWMFKFGGSYIFPYGIVFGTNVIYQQGSSWERTVRVPGLNQGPVFIKAEPRGSRRMPNELYFDLKLEKRFRIMDRFSARVSFDVFNLLNEDTPLYYVSTQAESPNFMVPTSIQLPRRVMVGVKLEF
ncbi:MAG: TonB-dependent receptor [Candidatus Aminicenantes bacterium]